MATIQLQISDDLIKAYGVEAIRLRLQNFLELDKLRLLALDIEKTVAKAGLDNDQVWDEARQKAWAEFKPPQLKELLP